MIASNCLFYKDFYTYIEFTTLFHIAVGEGVGVLWKTRGKVLESIRK